MYTTQQHLAIKDIQNNILLLKDGGGALVLQVDAVNFGLLSDREQVAIISSFAQMLNSLSFSIQIIIHSERLNITSYLALLDKAQKIQTNSLLSKMIIEYKQFIQSTIKENEVLDKKFYVVIPLFSIELGITAAKEKLDQKIKTILIPRRDQVIRQLARVGLKTTQLSKQKLVEVFYDIYNGADVAKQPVRPEEIAVKLKNPQPILESQRVKESKSQVAQAPQPAAAPASRPADLPAGKRDAPAPQPAGTPVVTQNAKNHPFVVEELE